MQFFLSNTKRLLSAMLAAGALAHCGEPPPSAVAITPGHNTLQQPMLRGDACRDGEYDETGLVNGRSLFWEYQCSGTLIAPDVLLTAAHCIHPWATMTFRPQAQGHSFFAFDVPVVRAVIHPEYDYDIMMGGPLSTRVNNPRNAPEIEAVRMLHEACGDYLDHRTENLLTAPNGVQLWACMIRNLSQETQERLNFSGLSHKSDDIALLFLKTPLLHTPYAALPSSLPPKTPFAGALVGYGENSLSWWSWLTGQSSGQRFVGSVGVYAVDTYEISAVPGPARVRKGDSGGPLFVDMPEGRVIAGIASRGDMTPESPSVFSGCSVYTRVDAYVPWINEEIARFRGTQK